MFFHAQLDGKELTHEGADAEHGTDNQSYTELSPGTTVEDGSYTEGESDDVQADV